MTDNEEADDEGLTALFVLVGEHLCDDCARRVFDALSHAAPSPADVASTDEPSDEIRRSDR